MICDKINGWCVKSSFCLYGPFLVLEDAENFILKNKDKFCEVSIIPIWEIRE